MALADIIKRIKADTDAEVAAILQTARQRGEAIIGDAQANATSQADDMLASAIVEATRAAQTIEASARLAVRDEEVSARRQLLAEAMAAVERQLAALPNERAAAFLAPLIVATARGGESIAFGSEDADRAAAVSAEVARVAPALKLVPSDKPAPFPHGVLLVGDRVRSDLSLTVIVADRRDELEALLARELFSGEA